MSHDTPKCRYCLGAMEPDTGWASATVLKFYFVCGSCQSQTPHGTSRESALYLANHPAPVAVPTPAPPAPLGRAQFVSRGPGHEYKCEACDNWRSDHEKSPGGIPHLYCPMPTPPDPSPEQVKLVDTYTAMLVNYTLATAPRGTEPPANPYHKRVIAARAALLAEFSRLDKLAQHYHNEASAGWTEFRKAEREIARLAALRPAPPADWPFNNPKAMASIKRGVEQAERGEVTDAPTPSETLTAPVEASYYPQGMIREYDAAGKLTRTANPEFYKITRREEWTDPAPKGTEPPYRPGDCIHGVGLCTSSCTRVSK